MNALTVVLLLAVAGYVCAQECSQDEAVNAKQCVTKFTEKGAPTSMEHLCELYTVFKECINKLSAGCRGLGQKHIDSVEKLLKEQGCGVGPTVSVSTQRSSVKADAGDTPVSATEAGKTTGGAADMVQVSLFSLVLVFLVTFFP